MAGLFSLVIFLGLAGPLSGSEPAPDTGPALVQARELVDAEHYLEAEKLLRKTLRLDPGLSECHFLLGFALAKQEKWRASREEFAQVLILDPDHGSAYTELAGVEYKLGNNREAIRNLQRAVTLDSDIEYVRNFLATLLYLENRRTEALYHWNKLEAPRVATITYRTESELEPELLLRLFPLNEGEVFRRQQVLDIRWKQERFRLGPPFSWQITPRTVGDWDLEVALASGSVLSSLELLLLENAMRAPLYREVSFGYPVTLRSGKRVAGSVRWDEPRKRAMVSAWLPFVSSSSDSLKLGFDLRDEQWRDRLSGSEFAFDNKRISVDYQYLFDGRRSLGLSGSYENQKLSHPELSATPPDDPHFAGLGTDWSQKVGLTASDDVQLGINTGLDGFFGYGLQGSRSYRVHSTVELRWLFERRSRSDFRLALGGGYASEDLPFYHYFILGIGQDHPLPLRAHPTVDQGRKGNSPMGRQYLLANLELHRRVLQWKVLEVRGLLFSDTAMVGARPLGSTGHEWFQDVGFGFRLGALGQEWVEVLFGFDLRDFSSNLWVGIPLVRW